MVNKKDLVIVALATFCLTATLFMVRPTKSNPGVGEYDPWIDNNEDGAVDIFDAINLANAFNTAGDPTKNVNVTNPRATVVEKDLNISVHGDWTGISWGETEVFGTEGYDRMFVSAAIVDIGNYTFGYAQAFLEGVYWYWGVVKGTPMRTYTPSDYNVQVNASVWNSSLVPISSRNAAEFAVEASQCSILFRSGTFNSGWVLLRVSIYLTTGTTSSPNTYVTNWPYYQPQPAYSTGSNYVITSIIGGYGSNSTYINIGGYSRLFVSIKVVNASYYGVNAKTTISLTSIYWGDEWYEPVPSGVLNATYYGTYLPAYSQQVPPEFKTKGSYCYLLFSISSEASFGWIEWYAEIYLRNE
jgi:hypothetical protein